MLPNTCSEHMKLNCIVWLQSPKGYLKSSIWCHTPWQLLSMCVCRISSQISWLRMLARMRLFSCLMNASTKPLGLHVRYWCEDQDDVFLLQFWLLSSWSWISFISFKILKSNFPKAAGTVPVCVCVWLSDWVCRPPSPLAVGFFLSTFREEPQVPRCGFFHVAVNSFHTLYTSLFSSTTLKGKEH